MSRFGKTVGMKAPADFSDNADCGFTECRRLKTRCLDKITLFE